MRSLSTLAFAAIFLAYTARLSAQASISPPVNHESGVVLEVFSGEDAGYRFCNSVVQWRDTTAFLPCASFALQRGARVDFVVYRTVANGHRSLRFANNEDAADDSSERAESDESQASMTAGKAPVEHVLVADSDGYRSIAYEATWHGAKIIVVDGSGGRPREIGDSINFHVIRTEANHQLSFTLDR